MGETSKFTVAARSRKATFHGSIERIVNAQTRSHQLHLYETAHAQTPHLGAKYSYVQLFRDVPILAYVYTSLDGFVHY